MLLFIAPMSVDIDECKDGTHQCRYNQICENTRGSYRCACPRGYRSQGVGRPCVGKLTRQFQSNTAADRVTRPYQTHMVRLSCYTQWMYNISWLSCNIVWLLPQRLHIEFNVLAFQVILWPFPECFLSNVYIKVNFQYNSHGSLSLVIILLLLYACDINTFYKLGNICICGMKV